MFQKIKNLCLKLKLKRGTEILVRSHENFQDWKSVFVYNTYLYNNKVGVCTTDELEDLYTGNHFKVTCYDSDCWKTLISLAKNPKEYKFDRSNVVEKIFPAKDLNGDEVKLRKVLVEKGGVTPITSNEAEVLVTKDGNLIYFK
jgi:hypothetical protein